MGAEFREGVRECWQEQDSVIDAHEAKFVAEFAADIIAEYTIAVPH